MGLPDPNSAEFTAVNVGKAIDSMNEVLVCGFSELNSENR